MKKKKNSLEEDLLFQISDISGRLHSLELTQTHLADVLSKTMSNLDLFEVNKTLKAATNQLSAAKNDLFLKAKEEGRSQTYSEIIPSIIKVLSSRET